MKRGQIERAERRERAEIRQDSRDKRTNDQQLALLDTRLGKGEGAEKERQRLSGDAPKKSKKGKKK
tara:strand:- start:1914 stop:2111 length:198 start_codon:yes stop_codon:yes gene_type:complete